MGGEWLLPLRYMGGEWLLPLRYIGGEWLLPLRYMGGEWLLPLGYMASTILPQLHCKEDCTLTSFYGIKFRDCESVLADKNT